MPFPVYILAAIIISVEFQTSIFMFGRKMAPHFGQARRPPRGPMAPKREAQLALKLDVFPA